MPRRLPMRALSCSLAVLAEHGLCVAGEFVLAQDEKPQAVIVIAERAGPGPREAASLFAEMAEKIANVRLPIVADTADEASTRPAVCIGPSAVTRALGVGIDGLGPSGIRIASGANWLVLAGPNKPEDLSARGTGMLPLNKDIPSGTRMAVLTFLQDMWDVDWVFPDELGLVHPSRTRLTVPVGLDVRYTPPFANRKIRNVMHNSRAVKGAQRLGLNAAPVETMEKMAYRWLRMQRLGSAVKIRAGHNFGKYWDQYGQEHPEWFALQPDGTRAQSNDNRERLCHSNVELRRQVVGNVRAYFEKNPQESCFSICLNDGGRKWFCTCEACRSLDVPEAGTVRWGRRIVPNMSDRVWQFATGIAAKIENLCPDKMVTAYAYSAYKDPPRHRLYFPNNLVIGVVGGAKDMGAWRGLGGPKFWRPNLFDMTGMGRNMSRTIAADIRAAYDAGVTITDIDCNLGHWTPEALNYYVTAKMLWAPTSDPDAWVDRFCRLAFGKGAGAMRKYFELCAELDDAIRAAPREQRPSRRAMQNYKRLWTPQWFAEAARWVDRAAADAHGDPRAAARTQRYRTALEINQFRVGYFASRVEWRDAVRSYNEAQDKRAARAALENARRKKNKWEQRRKQVYAQHVNTWILNVCYLGFYGT